jgi:hypothetical protein
MRCLIAATRGVAENASHQPTAKAERRGAFAGRLDVIVMQNSNINYKFHL